MLPFTIVICTLYGTKVCNTIPPNGCATFYETLLIQENNMESLLFINERSIGAKDGI